MSTKKLIRLATEAVERLGVGVVEVRGHRGHCQFTLQLPDGRRHRLVMSGSPSVPEHTVNAVVRDVKKLLS